MIVPDLNNPAMVEYHSGLVSCRTQCLHFSTSNHIALEPHLLHRSTTVFSNPITMELLHRDAGHARGLLDATQIKSSQLLPWGTSMTADLSRSHASLHLVVDDQTPIRDLRSQDALSLVSQGVVYAVLGLLLTLARDNIHSIVHQQLQAASVPERRNIHAAPPNQNERSRPRASS